MANQFLDTSALVKHYHQEVGTDKVDRLWSDPANELFVSRLAVVESVSVFAKKVRTGAIAPADFALLRGRLFSDIQNRPPIVVRMLVRHFQEADRLVQQHALTSSLYTLDALQLAVALDLRSRGMIDEAVAADHVFIAVGSAEGLKVVNPEVP